MLEDKFTEISATKESAIDRESAFMLSTAFFLSGRICDMVVTTIGLKNNLFDDLNLLTSYFVKSAGVDIGVLMKNAVVCVPVIYGAKILDEQTKRGARWLAFLGIASYIAAYNMVEQYDVLKHLF